MKKESDVLLDQNDDLMLLGGDFVVNESLMQDVGMILRLNQGDLKSDPLLGPNLVRLIRSQTPDFEIKTQVKLHLKRDEKDYDSIKHLIQLKTNGNL